ncbi:precorrin-2 dehydrogenase/sirohydrochlorin ferrochelatase family protein [Urbifossiella limnaea]|uniref:precorrin-2 dehydrogenase n=1 Tax=Urbifossiella limnaea TaxID=2528023 RepID=A0A517XVZ3_9BACT|nr:NAD(P)-dependent oxidoreductase [Urbifossiella limnaea]QDU21681.1 Precorrin-2 dehydrogenase [Urbifossiella limnaea]
MFPVTLDLAGRTVVVVGYGAVGRRKAATAAAAGAHVVVVDPAVSSVTGVPGLAIRCENYAPHQLSGAALVFACATPEVNARVVADGRTRGIWVNSATNPTDGDFTLPAVHAAGRLTLAVATGGASPALARRVRDQLADQFDATFEAWVELLNEVRGQVFVTVSDPARRRVLLDGFADWPWLDRLRSEGAEAVRAAMIEVVRGG